MTAQHPSVRVAWFPFDSALQRLPRAWMRIGPGSSPIPANLHELGKSPHARGFARAESPHDTLQLMPTGQNSILAPPAVGNDTGM